MVGVHIFAACGGGSTPPTPTAPTAAGVSVQSGDLPRGMVRCDLSGDIDGFIQKERSADPNVGQTAANQWSQARTGKASAAYVAI